MKKDIKRAFGKEIYLLGKKDGINYWLEAPSWDCGWYWGCGYVETYSNNSCPERARDISSHQHFDGLFFNKKNKNGYDAFLEFFDEITLEKKEVWTFVELMKTIYTLKDTAEVLGRGGSHYTTNPCKDVIINNEEVKRINEIILPALFEEVKILLTVYKNEEV